MHMSTHEYQFSRVSRRRLQLARWCKLPRYVMDVGETCSTEVREGYAGGCVIECRICNQEVAGSNLSLGYFAPRSTQPSIPPGSLNEYQLRMGRQRQVWLIPIADERVGVQVKL